MPIEANYDDVEEDSPVKQASASKGPPKLGDAEAFPDAGWGTGAAPKAAPAGKSFASLASEKCPAQKDTLDYSQPIMIKVQRPKLVARISKVRAEYKRDLTKSLSSNFNVYHDEGLPAGVSDKKAPCQSDQIGKTVHSLKDFTSSWEEAQKLSLENSCNVRVFKADIASPGPSDPGCEKGGKFLLRVKKELSRDMFEELCLYFCDGRLDHTTVGICLCIRQDLDVIQIWTKNVASAASIEVFNTLLTNLLGTEATATFAKHGDTFKKGTAEARRYYLEDKVSPNAAGSAQSVNNVLKPREFVKEKKAAKKGEFSQVPVKERKKPDAKESAPGAAAAIAPQEKAEKADAAFSFDVLDNGSTDTPTKEEPDDFTFLEKKKSDKSRKGSRKGSAKAKKSKGEDEFGGLATSPIIPQKVFVGAGLFGILFVAFLAIFMSGALN